MNSRYNRLSSGFSDRDIIVIVRNNLEELKKEQEKTFRDEQIEEKIRSTYRQLTLLETIEFYTKIRMRRSAENLVSEHKKVSSIAKELQTKRASMLKEHKEHLHSLKKENAHHLRETEHLFRDKEKRMDHYLQCAWELFELLDHAKRDVRDISKRSIRHHKEIYSEAKR